MLRDFGPGWQLQIARMYCTFQKVRRKDWGTPHRQCKYLQRIYLLILVLYNVYVVQMNSAYWWDSTENSFPKVKMNRSSFLRKTDDIESLIISDLVQAEHWRMTEQPQIQSEGLVHENTERTCSEMDPWQPELPGWVLVLGEFCFASSGQSWVHMCVTEQASVSLHVVPMSSQMVFAFRAFLCASHMSSHQSHTGLWVQDHQPLPHAGVWRIWETYTRKYCTLLIVSL